MWTRINLSIVREMAHSTVDVLEQFAEVEHANRLFNMVEQILQKNGRLHGDEIVREHFSIYSDNIKS